MLTHSNFVELAHNAAKAIPEVVNTQSKTLLFITTAHIFARFIQVLSLSAGARVGHSADVKNLLADLAEVATALEQGLNARPRLEK